jgi:hypothetical protein
MATIIVSSIAVAKKTIKFCFLKCNRVITVGRAKSWREKKNKVGANTSRLKKVLTAHLLNYPIIELKLN